VALWLPEYLNVSSSLINLAMFLFNNLFSRSDKLFFDSTGFVYTSSNNPFYSPFDSRYVSRTDFFCPTKSYLHTFYSNLQLASVGARSGYFNVLHVKGIGFKVFQSVLKRSLYFFLGYNHVTKYKVSALVNFRPLKGHILLFSSSKSVFGAVIYHVKHLRFPDPYRGKGIRNRFQLMRFKPGKQR
jgi:ribosomal protein L6P/L9E